MKINFHKIFLFFIPFFLIILFSGLQTSFWYQLFGNIPAPLLWLNVVIYISIYRASLFSLFQISLICFLLSSYTAMPLKMIYLSVFLLHIALSTLKGRVFWGGVSYFVLISGVGTLFFHLIYIFSSYILETQFTTINFAERMTQILLTPAFAYPTYWVMNYWDQKNKESYESGGLEYE